MEETKTIQKMEQPKTLIELFKEYKEENEIELNSELDLDMDNSNPMIVSKAFVNCFLDFKTSFADMYGSMPVKFIEDLDKIFKKISYHVSEYDDGSSLGDCLHKREIKHIVNFCRFEIHEFFRVYREVGDDENDEIRDAISKLSEQDESKEE